MDKQMKINYTNAIYRGKYLYGIYNWGGCGNTEMSILQRLQNKVMKLAIGKEAINMNQDQLLQRMQWRSMQQEVEYFTNIKTHMIINQNEDTEIKQLMKINTNGLRLQTNRKLALKPIKLIRSLASKATYRNRAYKYNMLPNKITTVKKQSEFKKLLKIHNQN